MAMMVPSIPVAPLPRPRTGHSGALLLATIVALLALWLNDAGRRAFTAGEERAAVSASVPLADASAQSAIAGSPSLETFVLRFHRALAIWGAGWIVACVVLVVAARGRAGPSWAGWLALGGIASLSGAGLLLQAFVTGFPATSAGAMRFATHVAIGIGLGAVAVLAHSILRWRRVTLPEWTTNGALAFGIAALSAFVLLVAGRGPGHSAARINVVLPLLGSVQPLEWIKPAVVIATAQWAGRHIGRLAEPWRMIGPVKLPHPVLALPLTSGFWLTVFAALFLDDFGSGLVLSVAFALMAVLLSGRASLLALYAIGLGASLKLLHVLSLPPKVMQRLLIYSDPFHTLFTGGDQVVRGFWAIAVGGLHGVGPGSASGHDIPAASNDLILAFFVESWGFIGLCVVVAVFAMVVASLGRAARCASPSRREKRFAGLSISLLLVAQAAVAALGSTGIMPLSGVTLPLFSQGGSALVATLVPLVFVAGTSETAPVLIRASHAVDERVISGWRLSVISLWLAVGGPLIAKVAWLAVLDGDEIAARPALARLADGRVAIVHNPRLLRLARQIPRARIVDRFGRVIAEDAAGHRRYPFGAALAAVTGTGGEGRTPLPSTLEARIDDEFATFPRRNLPVSLREMCAKPPCEADAIEVVGDAAAQASDFGGPPLRRLRAADLRSLVPVARLAPAVQRAALMARAATVGDVEVTIDAALQSAVYADLEDALLRTGGRAAAGVVMDAHSGEILVQASAPGIDVDAPLAEADYSAAGPYDPRHDFALYSVVPGSSFKLVTAIAGMEADLGERRYQCVHHPGHPGHQGNLRIVHGDQTGWVADHPRDAPHLWPSLHRCLVVSCNVCLAQLALDVGADHLAEVMARLQPTHLLSPDLVGIDLAHAGFGQGRALLSPVEEARLYAGLADDGVLRRCDLVRRPHGAACVQSRLASPSIARALAEDLRGVVVEAEGTGHRGREPAGAPYQTYGKTGTAEGPLWPGEDGTPRPLAWFSGFLDGGAGRRYAFAFLVMRGGAGGTAAAPLAPRLGSRLVERGYFLSPNVVFGTAGPPGASPGSSQTGSPPAGVLATRPPPGHP